MCSRPLDLVDFGILTRPTAPFTSPGHRGAARAANGNKSVVARIGLQYRTSEACHRGSTLDTPV